MKCETLAWI